MLQIVTFLEQMLTFLNKYQSQVLTFLCRCFKYQPYYKWYNCELFVALM